MKPILFIFAVFFLALAYASPAKESRLGTPNPAFANKCNKIACPDNYKPICGSDGKTKISFGNDCVMERYNCEHSSDLKKISDKECPGNAAVRLQ